MSKRLLILVDDELVMTRALALDLTEAGYEVETARDDEEAIRKVRRSSFDLVIAEEHREPRRQSGFVARFRRVQPAAKVVLMTTAGGGRGPVEFHDRGAKVRKPFDLEDFRMVVDRLLESDPR